MLGLPERPSCPVCSPVGRVRRLRSPAALPSCHRSGASPPWGSGLDVMMASAWVCCGAGSGDPVLERIPVPAAFSALLSSQQGHNPFSCSRAAVDRIVSPPRRPHILIPGAREYVPLRGKRNLAFHGGIQGLWRRLSWTAQVSPACDLQGPGKERGSRQGQRRRSGDTAEVREKRSCTVGREGGGSASYGGQAPRDAGEGEETGCLQVASGRNVAPRTG